MAEEGGESKDASELPLNDSVYISEEDDTFEKMKRGLKKFGKDLKKGAEDIAENSKKFATKSKEKYDTAREERKKAKALKDPLNFPWSSLSVVELKDNLKSLGLKVSGKKDDLIERILAHYRAEIPEMEDGAPHLIEDLEPIDENPPAPDIDELINEVVKNDDVKDSLEDEEIPIADVETGFEQVLDGPTIVVDETNQEIGFIRANPRKIKTKPSWIHRRANSVIDLMLSSLVIVTVLSILDHSFEAGIFGGSSAIINEILADRFIRTYGGVNLAESAFMSITICSIFFVASTMYFTGTNTGFAAMLMSLTTIASFWFRIARGLEVEAFQDSIILGELTIDILLSIPFIFTCFIPLITRTGFTQTTYQFQEVFSGPINPISESDTGKSFSYDDNSELDEGAEMSEFQVTRPNKPRRRGPMSFYEGLFLLISIILWPVSISILILLSLPDFTTRYGPLSLETTQGMVIISVFFLLSILSSYVVFRYDRDAREGAVYAKEKVAYHEQMDQFLGIKKAYYEMQASKLTTPPEE